MHLTVSRNAIPELRAAIAECLALPRGGRKKRRAADNWLARLGEKIAAVQPLTEQEKALLEQMRACARRPRAEECCESRSEQPSPKAG